MRRRFLGAVLVAVVLAGGAVLMADGPVQQPNVPINGCLIWWWRC